MNLKLFRLYDFYLMEPIDFNNIYICTKTSFGYKLVKANKIIDSSNYNIIKAGSGQFYLEKNFKFKKIDENDIGQYEFSNCKIIEAKINNNSSSVKTLSKLLLKIYQLIGNNSLIIKHTKLNIEKYENKSKCYMCFNGLSFPKPNENLAISEVITQSKLNDIKLELKMELVDRKQIQIKIN